MIKSLKDLLDKFSRFTNSLVYDGGICKRLYYKILSNIKNSFNKQKFVIYTTPVSEPLFMEIIALKQYENYENWLRELVDIFDKVHHFMYLNTISKNYIEYFSDSNHAYTKTNDIIAKKISGVQIEPYDFGMILTKENIEDKLQELRVLNGVNP